MSRADELFISTCNEILNNGVWDTDLPVRPRWEDGAPAHTVKKFGIVNRYNLQEEFPILTLRRTAFKYLGQLGGRKRLHRKGLRLSAGQKVQV